MHADVLAGRWAVDFEGKLARSPEAPASIQYTSLCIYILSDHIWSYCGILVGCPFAATPNKSLYVTIHL